MKHTDGEREKSKDGSVTVFLSLILVLLISIFLLSVESAHLTAARSHAAMKSDSVMESLFSRYEKELFEQFRLLALNSRMKPADVIREELISYDDPNSALLGGTNFLKSETSKVKVTETVYLTDQACTPFQEQVNEIVTADMVQAVMSEIMKYLKGTDTVAMMTEFSNRILENSSEVITLTEKLSSLYQEVQKIDSSRKELEDMLLALAKRLELYDEAAEEGLYEEFEPDWEAIRDLWNSLKKAYVQVGKNLKSYITDADKLNSVFQDILKDLKEADIEEEYRQEIVKSIESFSSLLEQNGDIYDGIVSALEASAKGEDILSENGLPEWVKKRAEDMTLELMKKYVKSASSAIKKLTELKIEEWKTETVEKSDLSAKGLISSVKKLISDGTLSLYVDNIQALSDRTVSMSEYPSNKCQSLYWKLKSFLADFSFSQSTDAMQLNYYLYSYLNCYSDGESYDLEYVIGKSKSDKENLKQTLNQLVLFRQAANCIYLFSDEGKRTEAKMVAAAMLAVTGNPLIIDAFTYVILAAWGYAEAVLDVRKLLAGERITFLKNEETFSLTLKQAVNVEYWTTKVFEKEKSEKKNAFESAVEKESEAEIIKAVREGLTYKDYLLLLLFCHFPETNRYRALDIIQWNVIQKDSAFLISQCIHSVSVSMTYSVQPVFVKVGKYSGGTIAAGYEFTHKETMSYLSG